MDTKQFCEKHGITCVAKRIKARKGADDWGPHASHWRVTLNYVPPSGARPTPITVEYSQGAAFKEPPTAWEVLDCLALDAASVAQAASFENWAGYFGYDTDSRKAESTYRSCRASLKKLDKLLGRPRAHELVMDVERL